MKIRLLLTVLFIIAVINQSYAQTPSDFIQVDQFGYLPNASKVAVLSDPITGFDAAKSYTASSQIQLRDASTNNVIFSAAPASWNNGITHGSSGNKGWWFDFSSITTEGSYYVFDSANNERSANFDIREDVYADVLKHALRAYYYNRCNAAKVAPYADIGWRDSISFTKNLQDANCRYLNDRTNAALEKDLTGGWFDAGDYNKYVTFAEFAVHNLLSAYQENPEAFGDNNNIPESGNNIPDIIDELKWELDWLLKMNNPDGSTHIKMGSISYNDNGAAPPAINADPRYYGPTCTAASIAVASMFAHASKVFS